MPEADEKRAEQWGDCFYMAMRGEGMHRMGTNPCASETSDLELSIAQGFESIYLTVASEYSIENPFFSEILEFFAKKSRISLEYVQFSVLNSQFSRKCAGFGHEIPDFLENVQISVAKFPIFSKMRRFRTRNSKFPRKIPTFGPEFRKVL